MSFVLAFVLGALGWTLTEYTLHRGWGHKGGSKNIFSVEHLRHHAEVTYFAPAWKKFVAALAVFVVIAPLLVWAFGAVGAVGATGFVVMYLTYEFIHKRLHTHPPLTSYGRWARRHHLYHHFKRPQLNHGVTSPIWDFEFRTLEVPPKIRVPRRNALPWMLDEHGDLFPQFSEDFEIVGKKRQAEKTSKSEGSVASRLNESLLTG